MSLWHLLLFVFALGAVTAWRNREKADWVENRMAWMFLGSFVLAVGIGSVLAHFQVGVEINNITSRGIVAFGFVWLAWRFGQFVPWFYSMLRSRYALRARPAQTPG